MIFEKQTFYLHKWFKWTTTYESYGAFEIVNGLNVFHHKLELNQNTINVIRESINGSVICTFRHTYIIFGGTVKNIVFGRFGKMCFSIIIYCY